MAALHVSRSTPATLVAAREELALRAAQVLISIAEGTANSAKDRINAIVELNKALSVGSLNQGRGPDSPPPKPLQGALLVASLKKIEKRSSSIEESSSGRNPLYEIDPQAETLDALEYDNEFRDLTEEEEGDL